MIGLVLVGLVGALAVRQVNARDFPAAATRRALVAEIGKRTGETDALRGRNAVLRADVAERRQAALLVPGSGNEGKNLADTLSQLQSAAGVSPVSGPGVVVDVDDAAVAGGADSLDPRNTGADGRVQDRDLQGLVNGLWAAGAEAVTVGDYRLTSLSAIRAAGEAILVDYRPLLRPYVIRAIGDPKALNAAVVTGAAGQRLRFLRDTAGVTLSISEENRMDLPGAQEVSLRSATVVSAESTPSSASRGTP